MQSLPRLLMEKSFFFPFIFQSLVSFEEVAVCFSKEEWTQLNPHQKALHGEVMRENLRNVAFLGKGTGM
uniref:KRAB domain-containing protein n=1 Tax=Laticauda laticaudata TaxID=8630 RepID=A0A8C5SG34_LATLA